MPLSPLSEAEICSRSLREWFRGGYFTTCAETGPLDAEYGGQIARCRHSLPYVTDGKLVVTAPDVLLDGSNLIVGANAATIFGTAVSADSAAAGSPAPTPVPEPETLVLLAAAAGALAAGKRFWPHSGR